MKPTIYCSDLVTETRCCMSCHDDDDAGYDNLLDDYSYETYNLYLCCQMKSYWKSLTDEDRQRVLVRKTS